MIFIARLVKCPFCGVSFDREKEKYIHYKNRYWHVNCYNEKFPNEEDKEKLRTYIKNLFNIDKLTVLINKQIKDYTEEYKYTYSGILGTLVYCYEIKKMDITKAKGIGIVPYNYEDAKNYFQQKKAEQKRVIEESKNIKEREVQKIKVKINITNNIKKRRRIL